MVLHDVTTCGRQGSVRTSPSGRRGTSRGAGARPAIMSRMRRLAGLLGKQRATWFSRAEPLLLFGQQRVVALALFRREKTVELLSRVVHHGLHSRPRLFANGVRRLELVPEDRVGYRALPGRECQVARDSRLD